MRFFFISSAKPYHQKILAHKNETQTMFMLSLSSLLYLLRIMQINFGIKTPKAITEYFASSLEGLCHDLI